MLFTPRDYLSTFLKLGTVAALARGGDRDYPTLQMPALTRFIDRRTCFCRSGLSVCVYYDCVRRGFRFPFADCFGNYPENARARGIKDSRISGMARW